MFAALGFNGTTEVVYLALLRHPEATVDELAARVGLSEAETGHALAELTRMSLVHTASATTRPRPVSPELGLSVLLARQQTEVARRQQEIEESRATFAQLLARYAEAHTAAPESGVERLEGTETILGRMRLLADVCEWEACTFLPASDQPDLGGPSARDLDGQVLGRGVRMRTVLLDSARNDKAAIDYATWFTAAGGEIRTVPTLPLRMLIVDRRLAVVPVTTDDSRSLAMEITIEGVVTALFALFQSVWLTGVPLGVPHPRDSDGLSPKERTVLTLLAGGATDEVIARRLGVSVRTARRIAADLLARLDARSRFQAGARAVVHGWLTKDDVE